MIFANPVPAEFATGDFYDHSGQYYLSEQKLAGDYAPVRFEREIRLFRNHCPKGRVLDVGCSTGAFLHRIKTLFPNNYAATGTDVAGPALDYAEKMGVPVQRGNFLTQTFVGDFDAVTFWAVVEHLVEPGLFLKKAASVLRPGGLCFVLVPNFHSLATRLLGARYRYILPQHVNYFTVETLCALCSPLFGIVRVSTTHLNPMVILQDFKNASIQPNDTARADLLRRTTAMKQSRALAPVKLLYRACERVLSALMLADNLVVVLRKKE